MLRAEYERPEAEVGKARMLEEKKIEDVAAVERGFGCANDRIAMVVREVVAADYDRATVLAEYEFHAARAAILARA